MPRAHIVLPEALLAEVDATVGKRGRSKFIAEAVAKELKHARLLAAFDKFVGSLKDVDVPGWETPESVTEWVHALRYGDEERLAELEHREPNQPPRNDSDEVV